MITEGVVEEFKVRMHITHGAEDDNLKRLLSFSYADIKNKCGDFDITVDGPGKELVFERTRYAYNDAIEYFNNNFLNQINSFSFENLPEEGDDIAEV
ncbi:phage head-tail connector protein [Bacillus sp. FJAT-45037]|uniref:phage head-tail connector protein n=1 Tax=Bacillus sp. FJAT-45037 TaxID=2011007 RepID=UPI000C244816|nr:phage head-tail connector protein [Bacillus sp. FJAT-45037]